MTASPGQGVLLKSDTIALPFRTEVQSTLSEVTRPPRLVGILSTDSKPSRFYADFTKVRTWSLGYSAPI
jgi:methylenetetrahydrofolate dehydrogenase (NAD+)